MAGVIGKIQTAHRNLIASNHGVEFSCGVHANFYDMVFGFCEDIGEGSVDSISSGSTLDEFDDDEQIEDVEKKKAFWDAQHQILRATLLRTTSLEARIWQATKDALRESQLRGVICICHRPVAGGCRSCLLRDISERLRHGGYECGICKSKWKSSQNILAGEHIYLDVRDTTSSNRGEGRVVIELYFQAEFEMARASEEYNKLISGLPKIFVGKPERLRESIMILCAAAKKCVKENKMHLAPWRKNRYMQAKWFGTCERTVSEPILRRFTNWLGKPRVSLLTSVLVDKPQSLQHCTTVKVA